jgi:predicted patatin/cPLA2 family phospholipase
MADRPKVALILVGGGMRSSHGAGFLHALGKELKLTSPDTIIASSGNAGNSLYYIAGQYDFIKRIWTELLATPKFISFLRIWRIMDIDYLIDQVFKKQAPMDIGAVQRSPIEYCIPVTNAQTGTTRYVTKQDTVDLFEVLRAAKAMPFFYGKKVVLPWGQYIDGELGPTAADHVAHALEQGADNIVLIDNSSPQTKTSDTIMRVYAHIAAKGLGDAVRRDISVSAVCLSASNKNIICLKPTVIAGAFAHSKRELGETFEQGVRDALALRDELAALFSQSTQ